jgi:hypothetical protein
VVTPETPKVDMEAVRQDAERKAKGFQLISEFIFNFSQLKFTMRVMLSGLLKLNEEQFNVVTSPYDFAKLCSVTQTVMIQQHPSKKTDIETVFNKCRTLNDDRVRIAHGLWTDAEHGLVVHHVARNSLKTQSFFENPGALQQLADRAQQLMGEVINL